jgi:hypothetical protein
VQRWPETKRLLGLLVNSSGRAHGRNARRLVHAARKQDRRLTVALLAAAVSHTPEGEEVLRGARMRIARKPSATARELLRNFPKGGKRRNRKRSNGKRKAAKGAARPAAKNGRGPAAPKDAGAKIEELGADEVDGEAPEANGSKGKEAKRSKGKGSEPEVDLAGPEGDELAVGDADEEIPPVVDASGDA